MKKSARVLSIIIIAMLICSTASFSAGRISIRPAEAKETASEVTEANEAASEVTEANEAASKNSDARMNDAKTDAGKGDDSRAASDIKSAEAKTDAGKGDDSKAASDMKSADANATVGGDADGDEANSSVSASVSVSYQAASIQTQIIDGQSWLFLPSDADRHNLKLDFSKSSVEVFGDAAGKKINVSSGSEFDVTSLFESEPSDGIYRLRFDDTPVNIMFSENIASVYIKSKDAAKNRIWVENDKKNKAKGSMRMINADGSIVYDGDLTQIKGRGNSSWNCIKKPYQIKLAESTDLQETGKSSEKNKTWVLLAGYTDHTLLHNQFTYEAAEAMGLKYTPHCRQINLYYDGEYRGVYLLIEKTEVGEGRVEVEDLEKDTEDVNSDISDFDILSQVEMKLSQGTACHYIDKLKKTDDVTGGYLLEMDFTDRAAEEKSWFTTSKGQSVVVKSPEYVPKENMEYIAGLYQEFEDAIYNGGINPTNHKSYIDMIDAESLAKVYILEELSMDIDAFSSSNYIYKKAGKSSRLTFGPVWDFDTGYGDLKSSSGQMANIECLGAANSELMKVMLKIPSFQNTVKEVYNRYFGKIKEVNGAALEKHMQEIAAATRMNSVLWPKNTTSDGSQAQAQLQNFINLRSSYLYYTINEWDGTPITSYDFYDVHTSDWYVEDVRYAAKNGIFNGTNPGYFSPKSNMTRAMAVTILYRISGSPEISAKVGEDKIFDDVVHGAWYDDAVTWAVSEGIVNGTGNGKFSPNRQISRQDFVSMLYRYKMSDLSAETTTVDTGEQVSAKATLANMGETAAETTPVDTVGHAAAKTTLAKTAKIAIQNPVAEKISKYENLKNFKDFDSISDYALEAISWSVENGIIEGNDRNMISPTATVNRAQAAAIIHRMMQQLHPCLI